jgi:energy-coupling factor transporter ATP-binding protein EcfA2
MADTQRKPVLEMPWSIFRQYLAKNYKQDQHVTLVGSTGCGKTTVALKGILPLRDYVCVFATKPRDPQLSSLLKNGYDRIKNWPPQHPLWERKHLLWPASSKMINKYDQREVFSTALQDIYESGAYTIYIDELHYAITELNLAQELSMIWQQGRSLNISLIAAIQRPSQVPLLAYSMPTHIFFWRENDEANLKRIGGIGWQDSKLIRNVVSQLYGPKGTAPKGKSHQFLYINTRSGDLIVSRLDL